MQAWRRWKTGATAMCVGVWLTVLAPGAARAAKVSTSVSFGGSGSLDVSLWYPDGLSVIRGVVVFTGGQSNGGSGDTRDRTDAAFWQAFGQNLGFGVLGTQFKGSYTNAADGPGDALLEALGALGEQAKHPELRNVPLLVEGFSNGGYFSFTFAQFAPERVIAFCVNKSGFARAPLDAAFAAVPGLLIWGTNEPPDIPTVIHSLVEQGRAQHALWAELREWDVGHEEGRVEPAFAPFFAEMVAQRYPAGKDPSQGVVALMALREESGWLADHSAESVEADVPLIASWSAYVDDKSAASWLPSEGLAKLWRGYVTKQPLALEAPKAGSRLDASPALQLSVGGLSSADKSVEFFDQRAALVQAATPSGDRATASWQPAWGGVRGVAAVARGASGEVARVSRPAHIVLAGKANPSATQDMADPMAPAPAADGGVPDASVPQMRGPASAAAGSKAGAAMMTTANAPNARAGGPAARAPDASVAMRTNSTDRDDWQTDAGGLDDSGLKGSCSCQLATSRASAPLAWPASYAVFWAAFSLRRARRRTKRRDSSSGAGAQGRTGAARAGHTRCRASGMSAL